MVDLDLFYGKVEFCNLGFYMGNATMKDSVEIIASCGQEIGLYSNIKLLNEGSCNPDQRHGLVSHVNQVLCVLY